MTLIGVADTGLRVEEVEVVIDVQLLVHILAVLLHEAVVQTVGLVFYITILQVGKHVPVVEEAVGSFQEAAVVVLVGVRVVIFVLAVLSQIFLLQLLAADVCNIAPVVAAELLQVHATDDVPVVVLEVHVVDHAVAVLCEALLAYSVVLEVLVLRHAKLLGERCVLLQLLIVATSVGVMDSHVVAPVLRGSPCERQDVVVLVEVVSGLVPLLAVAHEVRLHGVVAGSPCVSIVNHVLNEGVDTSQASVPQILVRIDVGEHVVGVIVACEHAVPCLSCLLEVADVLVTDLEVVAQPCQTAIVGS